MTIQQLINKLITNGYTTGQIANMCCEVGYRVSQPTIARNSNGFSNSKSYEFKEALIKLVNAEEEMKAWSEIT